MESGKSNAEAHGQARQTGERWEMTGALALYFAIICQVESGNGRNMIGPNGCEGWTQMRIVAVDDVNRISGTHYRPEDRHNLEYCKTMFEILVNHYIRSRNPTLEQVALLWCRGTKKSKKKDRPARVVEYLEKVRLEYERSQMP